MNEREWSERDIRRMVANPAYCLGGKPIIQEPLWIKAAMRRIAEDKDGGESFLRDLLENLRDDAT